LHTNVWLVPYKRLRFARKRLAYILQTSGVCTQTSGLRPANVWSYINTALIKLQNNIPKHIKQY